jgi:pyrroline-5-carboxylate reductase
MNIKLGFIGVGAMGGALCRGVIRANIAAPNSVWMSDPRRDVCEEIYSEVGARIAVDNREMLTHCDYILLAVKPHLVEKVLAPIAQDFTADKTLISVAAGVNIGKLESLLPTGVPVIRCMPNTPALVGAGVTVICGGSSAKEHHLQAAREIFGAAGMVLETEERLMDAVTGLSGSGPAYVYLFIEALTAGGVKAGLPRDMALKLATQTTLGAAKMILDTGKHPAELKDMVTTPGGTTIAGLAELERGNLRTACMNAIEAAAKRSSELGK